MANMYFEIKDSIANKWIHGKYFVTRKASTANFAQTSQHLTNWSDRVWCEQEGQIWFTKHQDPTTEVDLKEFMWIKLKAQDLR